MGWFKKIVNAVSSAVNRAVDPIVKIVNDANSWLGGKIKEVKDDIQNAINNITNKIENIIDKIEEEIERVGDQISDEIRNGLSELGNTINSLGKQFDDLVVDNIKDEVKNSFDYLANIVNSVASNGANAFSSILQGDLSGIEDALRQTGKDFEDSTKERLREYDDQLHELGRDLDDAVHAAVEPVVEAMQYVRDELIKPAWHEYRKTVEDLYETVEDEVVKPALDRAIAALDEVVATTMPSEFEEKYLKAKAAIDDAVDKIQETRDDVRESLKKIEDELKKAGHLIDDMKVQIMEMAAVIAVGFIPGWGPLLALALQAVLDEIHDRESLFDQLASGDFSNIDKVLIAVAISVSGLQGIKTASEAISVITKSLEVSEEVAKALEMASKAYEIYNKVEQYKDVAKAVVGGDFKYIIAEGLESFGNEFVNFASNEITGYASQFFSQIDLATIITNKDLISAVLEGDIDVLKNQALGIISQEISQNFDLIIPDIAKNIINSQDIYNLLQGDISILEDKTKNLLQNKISDYVKNIIPQNLGSILDTKSLKELAKGNFDVILNDLQDVVSSKLSIYISMDLPEEVKNILSDGTVQDLIKGDLGLFEEKLKNILGDEISNYLSDLISNQELLNAIRNLQLEKIKEVSISLLSEKSDDYLNQVLPTTIKSLISSEDIKDLIVEGKAEDLEVKIQNFLTSNINQYLTINLPNKLQDIITVEGLKNITDGDYSNITEKLQNLLVEEVGYYSRENLAYELSTFLSRDDVKNLIKGDISIIEAKLKTEFEEQIEIYKEQILRSDYIKAAVEFKDSILEKADEVKGYIDYAKDSTEQYQAFVEEYRNEFETSLTSYIETYEAQFELTKTQVVEGLTKVEQDFDNYSSFFADEFRDQINDRKLQINSLLFDAKNILVEEYVTPIIQSKEQLQQQLSATFSDIQNKFQAKIKEVDVILENLRSEVDNRIEEVKSVEVLIKFKISSFNQDFHIIEASNNFLSKEFYDKLQGLKTNISDIEDIAKNNLSEIQIIFNEEDLNDEISKFKSQVNQIEQNLSNAKINAVVNGTILTINSGLTYFNSDYLKNIINIHIKNSLQLQGYLDDVTIRNIVSETANWLRTNINVISGNANDTLINGTILNDYIVDNRGNDNINSGAGDDYVESGEGNDVINAGTGNDIIYGGGGDDIIDSGSGNDVVYGGDGNDRFVIKVNPGSEVVISDFVGGKDTVDISAFSGFISLTQLQLFGNISVNGNDTIITIENQKIILKNYSQLKHGDLVFNIANSIINGSYFDEKLISNRYTILDSSIIRGTNANDAYLANDGNNTILSGNGDDLIDGQNGDDFLEGESGNDKILGGKGNDRIYGDSGNDEIYAGDDDDSISGGEDHDKIYGENGNDYIYGENGNDLIYGGNGDDYLSGDTGNDILSGDAGNDRIYAGLGSDLIYGGDGNDEIHDGAGNDIITGGKGNDSLALNMGDDIYIYNLGDGKDVIQNYQYGFGTNLEENADKYGNDTILFGQSITKDDIYFTKSGNDLIIKFIGNDQDQITLKNHWSLQTGVTNLKFQDGSNLDVSDISKLQFVYNGTSGNDYISVYNGNSIIDSGDGNDTIYSGTGNDIIDGGNGDDYLSGDAGNDILSGDAGNDRIYAGLGSDLIYGGDGNDEIHDGAGNDIITGGKGNDSLALNMGDDIYIYNLGDGKDVIQNYQYFGFGTNLEENADKYGNDTILFGQSITKDDIYFTKSGNDLIIKFVGNDQDQITLKNHWSLQTGVTNLKFQDGSNLDVSDITKLQFFDYVGDIGDNEIVGSKYNDAFNGSFGNDLIIGDDGDDIIFGGFGNDILKGDNGNDIINGGDGDDKIFGGAGNNQISGGNGNDTIDLGSSDNAYSDLINIASGGYGKDIFIISDKKITFNNRTDIISDFDISNEKIDLSALKLINKYSDLKISQQGLDTQIVLSTNNSGYSQILKLKDVDSTKLSATNFIITNEAPNAVNDELYRQEDQAITINLLANDFDDKTNLSDFKIDVFKPENGTVKVNLDRTVTYTPNENFNGIDQFEYQITDSGGLVSRAKVTIKIDPINDAPVINKIFSDQVFYSGRNISFKVNDLFKEVDGEGLTYEAKLADNSPLPSWLNFNATTYEFSGKAPNGSENLTIKVTAIDDSGNSTSTNINFKINGNIVFATNGNDVINGAEGNDIIDGGEGDDIIDGGLGNNVIFGGDGNDHIFSAYAFGSNVMTGDAGSDTFIIVLGYASTNPTNDIITDFDVIDPNEKIDLTELNTMGITDIRQLNVIQVGSDVKIIFNNSKSLTINNIEISQLTLDKFIGIVNNYDNTSDLIINGSQNSENLYGGKGNDIIKSNGGNDLIFAGTGNDKIYGENGNIIFFGESGSDTFIIKGSVGSDIIADFDINDLNEKIDLSSFVDVATDLSQILIDQVGLDTKISFTGKNKTILVKNVNKSQLTVDKFIGITDNRNSQNNLIINGTSNSEILTGGIGDDIINGDNGNDVINANIGNNLITGGKGSDTFIISKNSNKTDVITDFDAVDLLQFNGFVSGTKITDFNYVQEGSAVIFSFLDGQKLIFQNILAKDLLFYLSFNSQINLSDNSSLISYTGNPLDEKIVISTNKRDGNIVNGGDGNDLIIGNTRDDTLNGGKGNDTLVGGDGFDIFEINKNPGDQDTILDFKIRDMIDSIVLKGFSDTKLSNYPATQNGNDVVIDLGDGQTLTLKNFKLSDLPYIPNYSNRITNLTSLTVNDTDGNDIITTNGRYPGGATIITVSGKGNDVLTGAGFAKDLFVINKNPGDVDFIRDINTWYNDKVVFKGFYNDILDKINFLPSSDPYTLIMDLGDGQILRTYGVQRSEFKSYFDVEKTINATDGNDTLSAGYFGLEVDGKSGDDNITGNNLGNILSGGDGNDNITAGDGNDIINGGNGDDKITTGAGNDVIDVGFGNDEVNISGDGTKIISGGEGSDIYKFFTFNGDITINDFEINNPNEKIDLKNVTNIFSFSDLVISQIGSDAIIQISSSQKIILKNTDKNLLNADKFVLYNNHFDGSPINDNLFGGDGSDIINGFGGNDSVCLNNRGSDTIDLGNGNDSFSVNGNAYYGNDNVTGGVGDDSFSVDLGYSYGDSNYTLTINDFEAKNPNEKIYISDESWPIVDFNNDLKIDQIGNDVEISLNGFGSSKKLILKNVDKADLNESNIILPKIDSSYSVATSNFDDRITFDPHTILENVIGRDIKIPISGTVNAISTFARNGLIIHSFYVTTDNGWVKQTLVNASVFVEQNLTTYTFNAFDATKDRLGIDPSYGKIKYSDLPLSQVGSDVIINFTDQKIKVVLKNTNLSDLNEDDFIFYNHSTVQDDNIYGGNGNDYIEGGDGDDNISGDDGDDLIFGGNGNDNLYDYSGINKIYGGAGDDRIGISNYSLPSNNEIYGEEGNDRIHIDFGTNLIKGGIGNDKFIVYGGDNQIYGEDGVDDFIIGKSYSTSSSDGINYVITDEPSSTIIYDFDPLTETIRLEDFDKESLEDFDIIQDGNDVVFNLSSTQTLRLSNVAKSLLNQENIIIPNKHIHDNYYYTFDDRINEYSINDLNQLMAENPEYFSYQGPVVEIASNYDPISMKMLSKFDVSKDKIHLGKIKTVEKFEDLKITQHTIAQSYGTPSEFTLIDLGNGSFVKLNGFYNLTADNFIFNKAPIVNIDSLNINEDSSIILDVIAKSYDADDDVLSILEVTNPSHGFATIITDEEGKQKISYIPNPSFSGVDKFDYTISDSRFGVVKKTLNITVNNSINNDPVATINSAILNEDDSIVIDVLSNASDADGDSLYLTATYDAQNGVANIIDGKIVYTPNANYSGIDSFEYMISDGNGGFVIKKLKVTINEINDKPIAENDSFITLEDGSIKILFSEILENDSDIEDGLELKNLDIDHIIFSEPQHGTIIKNFDSIIYIPNENYNGNDSISYQIKDSNGDLSNITTINLNINSINDAPTAIVTSTIIDEDNSKIIDVLAGANDVDGDVLTISAITQGSNGVAEIITDLDGKQKIKYIPNANYNGNDSITYTISDGKGGVVTKELTITVNSINDAPIIKNIFNPIAINQNSSESLISAVTIASSFYDADGDELTYSAKLADGSLLPSWLAIDSVTGELTSISPDNSAVGAYNIIITATDPDGESVSQNFSLVVNNVNDAPTNITLSNSSVAENSAGAVIGNLTTSDVDLGDSFTYAVNDSRFEIVGNQLKLKSGVSLDYEAASNISLNITATDAGGLSFDKNFTINVNNVNETPTNITLSNSSVAENSAGAVIGNLTTSDVDLGDSFTYAVNDSRFEIVGNQLKLKSGVSLDYEAASFVALKVTTTDAGGLSFDKNFTINVNNVNDAPTANNITATILEDNKYSISVTNLLTAASATDPDGDALTISSVQGANNGSVVLNNGNIIFTPNANYNGSGSFTFTVSDGKGLTITKTANLNITAVNDAPVVNVTIPSQSGKAGNAFTYTIPNNAFTDVDNSTLTYSAKQSNGSALPSWLTFNSTTKTFSGTPTSGVAAALSIIVTASDGSLSASQTFAINIATNVINGTTGNDTIVGTSGNDVINGLAGNDIITGGLGSDTIDGGNGTDTVSYADSLVAVTVNLVTNVNTGGTAAGDILSNVENITASSFNDTITGSVGNNVINGGSGNDTISAGTGNDQLIGGLGADKLTGGAGNDIFTFTSLSDSNSSASDIITDFTKGQDLIDLSGLGFSSIIRGTSSSSESILYYYNSGSNTIVEDNNHTFKVTLSGNIVLSASDFDFI